MAGSLDPSELFGIVDSIVTHEKDMSHTYTMPDTLVETGTYLGETPMQLFCYFTEIYTIEADPLYFKRTANTFPSNVYSLFGKSHIILRELSPLIQRPCIFYLDAHWWVKGNISRPDLEGKTALIEELDVIGERRFDDLIIIDDSRLFGQVTVEAGDWSSITLNKILPKIRHIKQFFEKEDRLVVHKQVQI